MQFRVLSIVLWATFCGPAMAQSLAEIGGPKELPPAGYKGQQYVDSRGCVFLKAGYGGQTSWVPRVNAARKALCGFPPTFAKVTIEVAEEAPAPAAGAVAVAAAPPAAKPSTAAIDPATYTPAAVAGFSTPAVKTPKTRAPAAAAKVVVAPTLRVIAPEPAPKGTVEVASSGPGPGKIGCYKSAPVAEVVKLSNGGRAVVCTRGDGTLMGWRPPIYPTEAGVGAALIDPVARRVQDPAELAVGTSATNSVANAAPKPPKGYKVAWKDDRLNPQRGKGTQIGWTAQDQVWTREVPSRQIADLPVRKQRASQQVEISSKTASDQVTAHGALVQVGTFGVPSNAERAAARLAELGLPVSSARVAKGGKTLQIVMAGPFGSGSEAQSALVAARSAGFSDAFLRR